MVDEASRLSGTASRRLGVFYVSSALGTVSHAMFVYGLVVVLTDRTHSAGLASLAYFMAFATMSAMTFPRAVEADRRPKIPLLRRNQLGMAAATGLLTLVILLASGSATLGIGAMVLAAVYGYASGGIAGTRMALLPEIVAKVATPTMVLQIMVIVGFGLGPPLYAAIRTAGGDMAAMAVVTVLLLASALSLPRLEEKARPRALSDQSIWLGIKDTIVHFRDVRALWEALLLGIVPALLVFGPVQAVIPRLISSSFPGDELFRGSFFSAMGVGLFLGGLLSLAHVGRSAQRRLLTVLFGVVASVALILMPFVTQKLPFAGLALLCGVGLGVPSAVVPVLLQEATGAAFRSRVMNANALRATLVPAVGAAFCGALSDATTVSFALAFFGVASALASAASLLVIRLPRSNEERLGAAAGKRRA